MVVIKECLSQLRSSKLNVTEFVHVYSAVKDLNTHCIWRLRV